MKRFSLTFIVALALATPALVLAVPGIPHQFYGAVTFTNGPAPDGLLVEVKVSGVTVGNATTAGGKYGYMPSLLFAVKEDGDWNGETAEFYVGGIKATAAAAVTLSKGGYTKLDLAVPGSVGTITKLETDVITNQSATVAPTSPTLVNMGSSLSVNISSSASSVATISKVEKLSSSFFTGATAVLSGNNVLNGYEIKISGAGLTITVTMKYDDTGIDESTVKPYKYNGLAWVEITPFTRDTTANTLTFTIPSAATPYALFGVPAAAVTTGSNSGGGGGGGGGGIISNLISLFAKKADANNDGKTDILDFVSLMANWGKTESGNVADFNNDGKVDILDFVRLMADWTK
jgi:hypothetical protein